MLSNGLIKKLCTTSDEYNLKLSENDWEVVLSANKNFVEAEADFRGSSLWGRYLLTKLGQYKKVLTNYSNSIELCCGNGFLFFSLYQAIQNKNNYFIDISSSQCESFKQRLNDEAISKNIICGDIGRLPFENNSFDLVYGNSFLHHLPDVPKYLAETYRVLKTDGHFLVLHEPNVFANFWESFPISIYKNTTTDSLVDIWIITPSVIERLLKETGFSSVDVMPRELFSSILITPLLNTTNKLYPPLSKSNIFIFLKIACYYLDKIIPYKLRIKYSPSIVIYAKK